jgi:Ca2+-binding EF-hand superfamily protein
MQDFKFTEEDARKFFRVKDKDGNGSLDVYEVRDLYKDICKKYGKDFDEKQAFGFLKKLDKNRDGKLNEEEFIQFFFPPKSNKSIKDEVVDIFKSFDRNQNGKVDRAELMNALKKMAATREINFTNAQLDGIFRFFDVNGDGEISLQEFASVL